MTLVVVVMVVVEVVVIVVEVVMVDINSCISAVQNRNRGGSGGILGGFKWYS